MPLDIILYVRLPPGSLPDYSDFEKAKRFFGSQVSEGCHSTTIHSLRSKHFWNRKCWYSACLQSSEFLCLWLPWSRNVLLHKLSIKTFELLPQRVVPKYGIKSCMDMISLTWEMYTLSQRSKVIYVQRPNGNEYWYDDYEVLTVNSQHLLKVSYFTERANITRTYTEIKSTKWPQ